MPPAFALTALWRRASVVPFFSDVAKAPWQAAQLAAYNPCPSVAGVGGAGMLPMVKVPPLMFIRGALKIGAFVALLATTMVPAPI